MRALAAEHRFFDAEAQAFALVKLTGGGDPETLEMLSDLYAETARYKQAAARARRALEIATRQGNDALAGELRSELAEYEKLGGVESGYEQGTFIG